MAKLAALFCIFLAVSIPFQAGAHPLGDSIAQILEEVITTLTNAISSLLDLAIKYINQAQQDYDSVKQSLLDLLNAELVFIEGLLDNDISGQSGLDADGLKLYQCFSSNWADINTAILIYPDGLLDCMKSNLSNILTLDTQVLADLQTVVTNIQTTATQLADCTDNTCIAGVLLEIAELILGIPEALSKDIEAIRAALPGLEEAAKACSAQAGTTTFQQLFKEFGVIGKCYAS